MIRLAAEGVCKLEVMHAGLNVLVSWIIGGGYGSRGFSGTGVVGEEVAKETVRGIDKRKRFKEDGVIQDEL